MRLPFVLFSILLATSVSAKGLRVCWEKIFLFLAYRIDQLESDANKRTIGFRCVNFDKDIHGIFFCKDDKYEPCEVEEYGAGGVKSKRNCMGIKEFLSFIDGQKWKRYPVAGGSSNKEKDKIPTTLDFDMNAAVKNLNDWGMDQNRYMAARVYKTPPGSPRDFNLMFEDIGETVKNYIIATGTLDGHPEIEQIRRAIDEIQIARRVDHAKFLVPHLQGVLPGVTIETPKVGTDVHGNDQRAFDPTLTVANNVAAHPNIATDLQNALNDYYNNDDIAKDHQTVMNSLETTRNKIGSLSCGI